MGKQNNKSFYTVVKADGNEVVGDDEEVNAEDGATAPEASW